MQPAACPERAEWTQGVRVNGMKRDQGPEMRKKTKPWMSRTRLVIVEHSRRDRAACKCIHGPKSCLSGNQGKVRGATFPAGL